MNRGRLFASIERVERGAQKGLLVERAPVQRSPDKPPVIKHDRPRRVLAANPAIQAAIGQAVPPARDPKGTVTLAATRLKVVLPLDPSVVSAIPLRAGAPAPPFAIAVDGRRLHAQVSAKSLRKCLAAIAEHGDKVMVAVQGRLDGDVVVEAGIVAQVRLPKGLKF